MNALKKISRKDRFLPCLLERLTDNEPYEKRIDREYDIFHSINILKKYLLRDIANLLNSKSKISKSELAKCPELTNSVINYGLDDICGKSFSRTDTEALQKQIKEVIITFEPRINPEKLDVEVKKIEHKGKAGSTYGVIIKGLLNIFPVSEEIILRSEIDFENGNIRNLREEVFNG